MRRITSLTAALLATLVLSGCATTGFLGFLVTTKQMNKALDTRDQEITALKTELEGYRTMKADAEKAVADMQATIQAVDELQDVADQAVERIAAIPAETIQRIVQLLQAALKE